MVKHDSLANTLDAHCNAIVGGIFLFDNFVGNVFYIVCNFVHFFGMTDVTAVIFAKTPKRNAGNICTAERGNFAVAVLAENKRVNAPCVNAKMLTEKVLEPCRVKNSARAEHPV